MRRLRDIVEGTKVAVCKVRETEICMGNSRNAQSLQHKINPQLIKEILAILVKEQ